MSLLYHTYQRPSSTRSEVKINRYHEVIPLACVVASFVFLFAICFLSTSPDTSPIDLAGIALPP
jgi:hypothetical protein